MTNFDKKVGVGAFNKQFGEYVFEVSNADTFGDIVESLREMALFMVENEVEQGEAYILSAAKFFSIPESYALEILNELAYEYQLNYA